MDSIINNLNNNPIFSGCMMLMMNIGGKYIPKEIPKTVDAIFLNSKIARLFIIFCIAFIATHEIRISLIITLLFILIVRYLLNENKKTCIVKGLINVNDGISNNEYEIAKKIVIDYENNMKKMR